MVTMSALLLPLLASAALLPAASSLAPCATAARCSGRAAALGYDFDPGTGGTVKGCVLRTADGTVRWTDGGAGEVATSDLPGGYERVYCEDEEGEEGGEDALPPIFNEPPEANDGGAPAPPASEGTAGGEEAVAPAAASDPADSEATATSESAESNTTATSGSAGSNATAADGGEASTSGEPAAATPDEEPAPVVRPCISLSTCRLASQSLGLAFSTVGGGDAANQTRGCFGEGGGVYWNDGEVYEEASMDLPPGRSRVHCADGPGGTVVGSLVVVAPCLTAESCEEAAGTRYSFSAVTANGTQTKGCFRKNDAVYWSPGTDDEMSDEDLPGVRRRVYCREDVSPAANSTETDEAKLHGPFAFTSKKNGTGTDGEDGVADAAAGGDGAGGDAAAVGGDGGGAAPPASGAVPARGTAGLLVVAVLAAATAV